MYKILITLISIFISVTVFPQQKLQLHTKDFNIHGKVKSFTSTTKNYKSINNLVDDSDMIFVQNDPNFISEYYFNDEGFLYESKTDEMGYTWKKYEFSNTKNNPLVTKITILSKGKIKEEYAQSHTIDVIYKKQSAIVTTTFVDDKQEIIQRYFDKKGNLVKEHKIPKTKKQIAYFYDGENNLIEQRKNNKNATKYTYEFNENKIISTKTETYQDGKSQISTYQNGLLISETYPKGYIIKYSYEFDNQENWIKRTTKVNENLVSEEFREYE